MYYPANVRPDEHFFLSGHRPRVVYQLSLGFFRFILWGPYPFLTLNIGNLFGNVKGRTLQIYLGIKCDATQTYILNQWDHTKYVMALTLKELGAIRLGRPDIEPTWSNQGGS